MINLWLLKTVNLIVQLMGIMGEIPTKSENIGFAIWVRWIECFVLVVAFEYFDFEMKMYVRKNDTYQLLISKLY